MDKNVFLLLTKLADLKPGVQLLEHQRRFVDRFRALPPGTGILAYHGLGSGKGISSIAATEAIHGKADVVVPAALRENYRKEVEKFVAPKQQGDFDIGSYSKALTHGFKPADVTVFDEAQRMGREESGVSQLPTKAPGRKIFLSGTPIRNEPSELVPLLKGLSPDRPVPGSKRTFENQFLENVPEHQGWWDFLTGVEPGIEPQIKNKELLKSLLAGRVDYHPSKGEFPTTHEQEIDVSMTSPQTDLYKSLMKSDPVLSYKIRNNLPPSKAESLRLNSFMNGVRQVSNNPASYSTAFKGDPYQHSPKMQRMVSEVKKQAESNPNFRGLIYSNYLDSGVKPLSAQLSREGISNAVFSGELNDRDRKKLVQAYNEGKIKTLLISGAGAEGLDLKGTRLVQIMEPHWNLSRINQVIGRAVRHQSHSHLPEAERNVQIQRYYSKPAPSFFERLGFSSEDAGADRYLHNLALKKQKLIDDLLKILQQSGTGPASTVTSST